MGRHMGNEEVKVRKNKKTRSETCHGKHMGKMWEHIWENLGSIWKRPETWGTNVGTDMGDI